METNYENLNADLSGCIPGGSVVLVGPPARNHARLLEIYRVFKHAFSNFNSLIRQQKYTFKS